MPSPTPTPKPQNPPRNHRWSSHHVRQPGSALMPLLKQFADDTWQLAQKSPALPADPAAVAAAARLLAALRRLLRREPGFRLLPETFAPGIRLHALALGLRQLQVGLERFEARDAPRSSTEEIDSIHRLEALFLRDITVRALEQRDIELPPDLQSLHNSRRARPAKEVIPAYSPRF